MKRELLFFILFIIGLSCTGMDKKNKNETGDRFARLRQQMVENQIRARGVKDPRVLAALEKVPRHLFVPENLRYEAYQDEPLPIGFGQTISQPYIVAYMTEQLRIQPGDRVLEIGTGSGYQAAILAELADSVFTIEIVPELSLRAQKVLKALKYHNIQFKIGDGYEGWPEKAPFDAIMVTAAPDHVPQPLVDQLKDGGRLIIPVGDFYQDLVLIEKKGEKITRKKLLPVRFVPMKGEAEKE